MLDLTSISFRDNLESDLKIEKEWRESTRGELQREKDRNVELQQDSRKLKTMQSVSCSVTGPWMSLVPHLVTFLVPLL